jgi:hypothetical protein
MLSETIHENVNLSMIDETRKLITTIYSLFTSNKEFHFIRTALVTLPTLSDEFLRLNKSLTDSKGRFRGNLNALSYSLEELDGALGECKIYIAREREKERLVRKNNRVISKV